jgi:methyl-accepting chemotaxis protein
MDTAATALFQTQDIDPQFGHDLHLIMIFAGIIALALVVQAIGVSIAGVFAAKLFHKFDTLADKLDAKTMPIMEKTSAILSDITPKIHAISTNVEQFSYTVRTKCDEIGETVSEINRTVSDANFKTRTHIDHVHGIVTDALATTEDVSVTIQESIRKPVRQIAGIIAGVRAGIETLVARSPFGKSKNYENPYDL